MTTATKTRKPKPTAGYRFYLEHDSPRDKRKGKHNGNVCAVAVVNGYHILRGQAMYEGLIGIYNWPDSAVCWCSMSVEYIRTHCKRISAARAREIHPALFARLEMD